MKTKFLALLAVSALFVTACQPVAETTEEPMDDSVEMEEGMEESMEEEASAEMAGSMIVDFDQDAYDAALAAGGPVFLDFHASWCPTCVKNASEIEASLGAVAGVTAFRVDYDNSSDLQATYGVTSQSTLVLVQGEDVTLLGPGSVSEEEVLAFLQS